MRKRIVKTTAVVFAALMAVSSVGASAKTTYLNYDLEQAYYITNTNNSMKIFYDYGTSAPNDDVRAATEAACSGGMTTRSYVFLTATNGRYDDSEKTKSNLVGYVNSDEACVPGQDYAQNIIHSMQRKENSLSSWGYELTYNIT